MSVRLAESAFQPQDFSLAARNRAWADEVIADVPQGRQQPAMIPLLWRAEEFADVSASPGSLDIVFGEVER